MRERTDPPTLPLDPGGEPVARGVALSPDEFAGEFDAELVRALAHLGPDLAPIRGDASIGDLLVAALRDEFEAAEIAASWMAAEVDLELKLGLARQVGDEAKHYRLLADRLRRLGIEADGLDPRARGYSHVFRYLKGLETAAERLASNAAREGIARLHNVLLAEFCAAHGDEETARLFREVIGPDEAWHLDFSRRMVARHAPTADDQQRARRAMARTLHLAVEDLAEATRAKGNVGPAP